MVKEEKSREFAEKGKKGKRKASKHYD